MASEGPRATVTGHLLHRTAPRLVGRGPVPRQRPRIPTIAGDRPPRYGRRTIFFTERSPLIVGRGPVPRHAGLIGRSRGTGPRATRKKNAPLTVGRGTGPRHAAVYRKIAGDRPPRDGTEHGYSRRFTSPNVRNCRFAAETGPRKKRIDNSCGLPANETSSN